MPLLAENLKTHNDHISPTTNSTLQLQFKAREGDMSSMNPSKPTGPAAPGLRPPQPPKSWAKKYRTQWAAITGTAISTFVTFPLESVKTRLQANAPNFKDCVRQVWKEEGVRGFWRGCAAPMFSVTCVRTFGFSVYQDSKYATSRAIASTFDREEPLVTVNKPGSKPDVYTTLCFGIAGAISGAFSSFVSTPFDTTKTGMVLAKQMAVSLKTGKAETDSIRASYMNKGTFGTARQIVRNCGFQGLYCGFPLQFSREVIGTSTYFMIYEGVKQTMVAAQGARSPTSPLAVALAGGFCGMISLIITYPLDLVKTSYQKKRLENGRAIGLRAGTVRYFDRKSYQGVGVAATRSAITNAILFSFFEMAKKYINELPDAE